MEETVCFSLNFEKHETVVLIKAIKEESDRVGRPSEGSSHKQSSLMPAGKELQRQDKRQPRKSKQRKVTFTKLLTRAVLCGGEKRQHSSFVLF